MIPTPSEASLLLSSLHLLSAKEVSRLLALLPTRTELATARLIDFVRLTWSWIEAAPFIDNWHIGGICEHLQAVTEGQIQNLVINVPPGCTKSMLVSVFWPAWEWTRQPETRWFFASYDQRLSTRDSVNCRALIASQPYQEAWGERFQFTDDQNQKTYYATDKGGWRLATSIGGHGTGEHPHRIVVDDAMDAKGANSPAERQAVRDWWNLTMSTRGVTLGASRVIIAQRLSEDDLPGHVLQGGGYEHICLPMRYEPGRMKATSLGWTDPRTTPGELLTPRQFDEATVTKLEQDLGPHGTAGQLQQRPMPPGGTEWPAEYFPDSIWVDDADWPDHFVVKAMSLDPSKGRSDKTGDYAAFIMAGLDSVGRIWIRADLRRGFTTSQIVDTGINHCQQFGASAFVIEINQFQELLAQEFVRVSRERRLALPVWGINNHEPKVVRIRRIGPYLARGEMRFLRGCKGTKLLVDQLRQFPTADHDDGPDGLEQAIRMIRRMLGDKPKTGAPELIRG